MRCEALIPPARPRVLVIQKRTMYEWHIEQAYNLEKKELLGEREISLEKIHASHQRHKLSLKETLHALTQHPRLSVEVFGREELATRGTLQGDLIIAVGGDGTVLETSHTVVDAPLLGINSDPENSVGFLCSGSAKDVPRLIEAYLNGDLIKRPLSRLSVRLNGKIIGSPVLNDILFAHQCPAATSRYIVHLDDHSEAQKSSGMWISTAAGSTAAIRSAGGLPMDLADPRIQFRVREPYMHPSQNFHLIAGWIEAGQQLLITSRMMDAGVYLDGPHIHFSVQLGDQITICAAKHPLWQVWTRARTLSA